MAIKRRDVNRWTAALGASAFVAFGVINVVVAQQPNGDVKATGASVSAVPAPTAAPTTSTFAVQGEISAAPSITGRAPYFPGQSPNHIPQ